jgi:LPXTG-motif cell wall-anchored protein
VKLSIKKFRRSATIVGGAFVGLGVAAAMATPALACHPSLKAVSSCVNSDGSWVINWSVRASDRGIGGDVTYVDTTPANSLTGIVVGAQIPAHGSLKGVQTISSSDTQASIKVVAHFVFNGQDIVAPSESGWIQKPTKVCHTQPTAPTTEPSTPATTSPTPTATETTTPPPVETTSPSATPTASQPLDEPQLVYDATCTTFTVGVEIPKTWKTSETVTFTPSVGSAKTVTAKPGETKTVDFPASKGLTVKASAPDADQVVPIDYKAPKDCSSPAATPSTSKAALAITGSSSTPIAGGAVALVLLGGGAFFMARRRKMKFTA